MHFPLKKSIINYNNTCHEFLENYQDATEIPVENHPGSFAFKRKNHIHEGVDLYCENGDEVFAIESGIVVNINHFTGEFIKSPWWNNTKCIMVEGSSGVFNYGELMPLENLKIGDKITEGQLIGHVTTVLKENKGRPMNMLHLELYQHGTNEHLLSWDLDMPKPDNLLDPTSILVELANQNHIKPKNKYKK